MNKKEYDLLRRVVRGTVNLLYPPVCPLCDRTLPPGEQGRLCSKCADKIKPLAQPLCMKCGRQLDSFEQEYCEQCGKHKFHFERGFSVFGYETNVRELLMKLKYKQRKDIAEFFGNCAVDLYSTSLKRTGANVLIPVPIHKKRLKQRGYNQALAIAEIIAEKLNMECVEDLLVRTKQTEAQKGLSANERLLNLYHAFDVDTEILLKCKKRMTLDKVILVDDIFTTGSTIECCTMVLKKYGVKEVYFVCAAATYKL
ncbi:MAG: ComF family protein [Lachnospiraceae bacterium]